MPKLSLKLAVSVGIGAAVVALALPVVAPAGAAALASKPSTSVLVPASSAKKAGFTEVANPATATTNTGITGCPDGAQEELANASANLGLLSETVYCQSATQADNLLQGLKSNGKTVSGLKASKGLGSTAVALSGANSSYFIAWRTGNAFEVTGMFTDLSATNSGSTSTTVPSVPLTAHDATLLEQAASQQAARFKPMKVAGGTGQSGADAKAQAAANTASAAAGCPKNPTTALKKSKWSSAPAMTIDTARTYTATVKTDVGTFVIALDAKGAPQTVNNFVFLAQHHFYDCVIFHRVIPGFVDQTGDPTGTGGGGPGYTIADELPAKAANAADQYPLGSVAMANTGQPHTGGSQWFVVAGAQGESLPNSYTLFGHVTSGMKVVDKINAQGTQTGTPPAVTHRMLKVTITSS